jgi:uncharacterized protein
MPRGTRQLPGECVELLGSSDLILHAGDFTSFAVLEQLRELAPLEGVVGNMDEPELRAILPERRVVEAAGCRIGMIHDAGPALGRAERLAAAFPGCAAVIYGHTHMPEATRLGETWILNPGSPTERRYSPHHGMLVLEVENGQLDVRTYVL